MSVTPEPFDAVGARDFVRDVVGSSVAAVLRDLYRAGGSARVLAGMVDNGIVAARARARAGELALDLGLDRELADAGYFAGYLALDLDGARSSEAGVDIERAIDHARDLVTALGCASIGAPDLDRARVPAGALADDLIRIRARARALELDLCLTDGAARRRRRTAWAARCAGWLLAIVLRILPAPDRSRYAQEFLSELWELAAAGQGRRQQLRYGCRQLRSVLRLRMALRARRGGKGP